MSTPPALILILGDQLTPDRGALREARPGVDTVVMAEVRQEATYVRHNKQKIALIFSAMRHFRDELLAIFSANEAGDQYRPARLLHKTQFLIKRLAPNRRSAHFYVGLSE